MAELDMANSILEYFQRFGDPNRKTPYRIKILDSKNYKCFLMIWPLRSKTPMHDHNGVTVTIDVLTGVLRREVQKNPIGEPREFSSYFEGDSIKESDGHLPHIVINAGADWAVSLHTFRIVDPGKYKMNVYEGEGGLVDGDDDIILPKFKIPLPKKRRK